MSCECDLVPHERKRVKDCMLSNTTANVLFKRPHVGPNSLTDSEKDLVWKIQPEPAAHMTFIELGTLPCS